MVMKPTWQQRVFDVFNALFMIFMIVISFYPLWYVICASFSNPTDFIAHRGLLLLPIKPTTIAYRSAFEHPLLLKSYLNTIIIVVGGCALNIAATAVTAYFLSRRHVMWKRPITLYMTFTMYFSGGLIPCYFLVKNLGLYDSRLALVLPGLISMYNTFVMRAGFDAIPDSLEESAWLDGAGHLTILFKIFIPLALPTMAVVLLYYGVGHWNSWFTASIYLQSREKFPLQLILRQILLENNTSEMSFGVDTGDKMAISETIKHAVSVIATVPILCLYPFLQKYFIKGVMIGAVKG